MKLICLNIWGGRIGPERLLDFFRRNAGVDVFCLQEVYSAPQQDYIDRGVDKPVDVMWYGRRFIEQALPQHQSYFHSQYLKNYGLQLLTKRQHHVEAIGDIFVHQNSQFIPEDTIGRRARNLQYATITTKEGPVTIINFHGLWNGNGKSDSKERLEQSRRIVEFLRKQTTPIILVGDFNLLPDTQSMAMLEHAGLRNLIKDFGITSTRTSLYTKPIKFADYVLVSPQINVIDFRVLPDEVSDHSALLLEVSP